MAVLWTAHSEVLTIPCRREGAKLRTIGWCAALVVVAAMIAGRVLPASETVLAASVQAAGSGLVLWAGLAGRRWVGAAVGGVLLAGVWIGASYSAWAAREAPSGLAHAMLYAGLAIWFGRSLVGGGEALVTQVARRLNPRFRAEMVPYTRAVTAAWCVFALAQLAASALLLAAGWWAAWALLINGAHAVLAAMLAIAEFVARSWRFPGEHTGFWDTVRGFRRSS